MNKIILDNFADAIINIKDNPIFYRDIEYYPIEQNYNLDNVQYLTIDYNDREIIFGVDCIVLNNNYIICCNFTHNKIVNNIEVEGIYIVVNKLIKLTLKYITWVSEFTLRHNDTYFDDSKEITRDDFIFLNDNISLN